jgi:hypothetical protein
LSYFATQFHALSCGATVYATLNASAARISSAASDAGSVTSVRRLRQNSGETISATANSAQNTLVSAVDTGTMHSAMTAKARAAVRRREAGVENESIGTCRLGRRQRRAR